MPSYYVEDYEQITGKKPEDAPVVETMTEAKVVEPEAEKPAAKKTSAARTKAKSK